MRLAALVWRDGYNGEVGPAISNLVSRLRQSLPAQGGYIVTVPKSGYKLSFEVDRCEHQGVDQAEAISAPQIEVPLSAEPLADVFPVPAQAAMEAHAHAPELMGGPRHRRPARRWVWMAACVAAILLLGVAGFLKRRTVATSPAESLTIGLLPFAASGLDAATAETIREQLADALAEVPGTEVRAAHSLPDTLTKNPASIPGVAQRLNLTLVVATSISVRDGAYHCDLELIRGSNGDHVSSLRYDGPASSISRLPQRIDQDLVPLLLRKPETETQRALGSTSNQQAFDLAFQANAALQQRSKASVMHAIDLYSRAVSLDPMFAHAWTGLGEANLVRANFGSSAQTGAFFQAAIDDSRRALRLNPNDAQGHSTLGLALLQYNWNLRQAEQELSASLERNPSSVVTRLHFAVLLADDGRVDEAIAQVNQARALDPEWPVIFGTAMYVHIVDRQFSSAIADAKMLVSLAPNWSRAHQHLGWAYWYAGRQLPAIEEWRKADELDGRAAPEKMEARGAEILAGEGVRAYALYKLQHELAGPPDDDFVAAEWYAFAGDPDQTLAELQTLVRKRDPESLKIPSNPAYDFLRSNKKYREVVEEVRSLSGVGSS